MMNQDAHDGLYKGMDPEAQVQGGFATDEDDASQSARNNALKNHQRQDGEMTALLAGDNQSVQGGNYNNFGQTSDAEPDTQPYDEEKGETEENEDVNEAKESVNMNGSNPSFRPDPNAEAKT